MVWGLFPVDPLPGEDKYYIFMKGTYKVGRKGCDIIINKDKGVSRVHAEIVVDAMSFPDPLQDSSSIAPARVWLKDYSKYGTFVQRKGSKKKILDLPNKETTVEDGDILSFGAGAATYRFCFVPFVFLVSGSNAIHLNDPLGRKISSIGGRISYELSPECTHVLAGGNTLINEDLIDAIVARKPFVLSSWIELISGECIRTDIPSCSSYAPTVTLDGVTLTVADPKSRENCLKGFTFFMESTNLYKYNERLQSLINVGGAVVLPMEGFYSASQGSEERDDNRVICVIPEGRVSGFDHSCKLNSCSRIKETDIVSAVITGCLNLSILISPPVLVSSSCSTDETIVADSDDEVGTATTTHATDALNPHKTFKIDSEIAVCTNNFEDRSENVRESHPSNVAETQETTKIGNDLPMSGSDIGNSSESGQPMSFRGKIDGRIGTVNLSDCGNTDVIYSQELIVRDRNLPGPVSSTSGTGVPNYKSFRKIHTQSGNSFSNLIPFSKYPYKNSECGNEEVVESMKEEKKRKQMEAVADDLFNNQRGKQRGVPGSLLGLLTRG